MSGWGSSNTTPVYMSTDLATNYLKYLDNATGNTYTFEYYNDHGVTQGLSDFVTNYMYTSSNPNVASAIDSGYPVMGTINNNSHEVMITGYNNDGTYEYFDPQLGAYNHASSSTFTNLIKVGGVRPAPLVT